jgi:hypothetical protein
VVGVQVFDSYHGVKLRSVDPSLTEVQKVQHRSPPCVGTQCYPVECTENQTVQL